MRLLVLLALALLTACGGSPSAPPAVADLVERTGEVLGLPVTIQVQSPDKAEASRALDAAFAEMERLETIFDAEDPKSELRRLSAKAGGEPVPVSRDLWDAISRALDLSNRSRDAYDPTLKPYTALWARAHASVKLPTESEVAATRLLVGRTLVELHPPTRAVRLKRAGMQLDLGPYAHGFVAQAAWAVLGMKGSPRCVVQLGSTRVVGEAPRGTQGWRIVMLSGDVLRLRDICVAESSAAPDFVEIDGTDYAALLDPRTGRGLLAPARAVIVAQDAPLASMLAHACTIWGPEEGTEWVRQVPGAHGRVLGGDGQTSFETEGFAAFRAP